MIVSNVIRTKTLVQWSEVLGDPRADSIVHPHSAMFSSEEHAVWYEVMLRERLRNQTAAPKTLEQEIGEALNRHSAENASDTPDFVLAQFLIGCLAAWNKGLAIRQKWYSAGTASHPTISDCVSQSRPQPTDAQMAQLEALDGTTPDTDDIPEALAENWKTMRRGKKPQIHFRPHYRIASDEYNLQMQPFSGAMGIELVEHPEDTPAVVCWLTRGTSEYLQKMLAQRIVAALNSDY